MNSNDKIYEVRYTWSIRKNISQRRSSIVRKYHSEWLPLFDDFSATTCCVFVALDQFTRRRMSSSTPRKTRQTRATTASISNTVNETTVFNDFQTNLQSLTQFIDLYNRYYQTNSLRPVIVNSLCQLLGLASQSESFDEKTLLFILDCLVANVEHLNENQIKEYFLPFFKNILTAYDNNETFLSTVRLILAIIKTRSNLLTATLAEWLTSIFQFLVLHLSSSTYLNFDELFNDLFANIIKFYSPLSKDLVDVMTRSSLPILSTMFLNQIKIWIHHTEDLRFALFALQIWQSLAKLFSRLVIRGHAKGNHLLTILEDAFTCSNNAIQSATFTVWSSFITHLHQIDELEQSNIQTRLLKLFLLPFLSDSTSKSKSASISKCHAWLNLISFYPTHVSDVILPFLSFAFGKHTLSKSSSTTTAWWPECRQIGAQYLHDLLVETTNGETVLRSAGDEILGYIFDFIVEQFFQEQTVEGKPLWLTIWNSFLKHLLVIFQSNQPIQEKQRMAINTCLLTRIEQCWIDGRIETRLLLKLFESFEQIGFPLAVETVLRDTSVRTKTLSATQNFSSLSNKKSKDEHSSHGRTTLSDQYLHMMIEHAIRFNDEDQTIEEAYLHVMSYLIETLSKTSDENFCTQSKAFLLKCSVELTIQPMAIPHLFWHIWSRCSTHIIQILNRSHTFESTDQLDNQKQEAALELLLRPFAFNDIPRLDYSTSSLWIQLFKALCRLALLNPEQSKTILMHFIAELLRHTPAFEQAIHDEQNQRVFGLILIICKTLIKTLADTDLSSVSERSTTQSLNLFSMTQKRTVPSSTGFCLNQISLVLNHILQRLLTNNENNTQYSLVSSTLSKSIKSSSLDQSKLNVFNYVRDLLVDLFGLCKVFAQFDVIMKNLTELLRYLNNSEPITGSTQTSPVSVQKQTSDLTLLTKILSVITSIFETAQSAPLLQLTYPLFILAFQHNKTIMRNKARKCWNETFGRLTFLVYPNELRACLRDLKEKEHLLLPCFLADQDNSNTVGSGAPPTNTDESQLSQQIDIVTPLIRPSIPNPNRLNFSSPTRAVSGNPTTNRTITSNQDEPVFVPITNNINYANQSNSPINANKRRSVSANQCLTEKQKEKLRTRNAIPLLCDDHSNTQSNSCTVDTSFSDQEKDQNKVVTNTASLFNSISSVTTTTTSEATKENDSSDSQMNNDDDFPEESSISKKLRRSCRPSISARKSLVNKMQKKPAISDVEEIAIVTKSPTPVESTPNENESAKKNQIKSILKRLSPTKSRPSHTRRVVFHDQVKVLVFASPSRRDPSLLPKKRSPTKDENKSPTRTIPKENLPLRKQPMSARRLSAMPQLEQNSSTASPTTANKIRSSKLFHPNDAVADWTKMQSPLKETAKSNQNDSSISTTCIYPNLISCNQSLDSFISFLCDGECPSNLLHDFYSMDIKTVADLARASEKQVENFPVPEPKLIHIRKALVLFENHQEKSLSIVSQVVTTNENIPPIASTSEEILAHGVADVEMSSSNQKEKTKTPLYDVEELIASLDYEKFRLTDNQTDSRTVTIEIDAIKDAELSSPGKRHFLATVQEDEHLMSPKKAAIQIETLGDRLQKAADVFKISGSLPFDDDYIELVRQLIQNSALTNPQQIRLKNLVNNQ